MPKIICTLPNASTEISGVKFTPLDDGSGVVSDEIHQDVADAFLSIPGYELAHDTTAAEKAAAEAEAEAEKASIAAEKAALHDRAAAIDFKVKANWSLERLKAEVEGAEKAAAEAADHAKAE